VGDEYTLDAPPPETSTNEARIREPPLKKMCERYGTVEAIGVRSAFASRYGHVEYSTVQEAQTAYKALNGAKLLHKIMLVQPTKPSAPMTQAEVK
jgi:RNA recognition motif-containing protein